MEEKKNNKKIFIIIALICILVVAVLLVFFLGNSNGSSSFNLKNLFNKNSNNNEVTNNVVSTPGNDEDTPGGGTTLGSQFLKKYDFKNILNMSKETDVFASEKNRINFILYGNIPSDVTIHSTNFEDIQNGHYITYSDFAKIYKNIFNEEFTITDDISGYFTANPNSLTESKCSTNELDKCFIRWNPAYLASHNYELNSYREDTSSIVGSIKENGEVVGTFTLYHNNLEYITGLKINFNTDEIAVEDSAMLNKLKERADLLANGSYTGYSWGLYKNMALGDDSKTFIALMQLESEKQFTDLTNEQRNQEGYDCLNSYITKEEVAKKFNTMFEGSISTKVGFPFSYKDNLYYFGGCGGYVVRDVIISYNYKYTHNGDKYYVYQSIGVADPAVCDDCGKVYLDVNKIKTSDIIYKESEEIDSIITKDNYKMFSQYKLEFELKNGNLIFKGIMKIA